MVQQKRAAMRDVGATSGVASAEGETSKAPQKMTPVVPLSLSLVTRKEDGLKAEKVKLQHRLRERTKLLCGLRENHEHLLRTNGQLHERKRLRRAKLLPLRTQLETDQYRGCVEKAKSPENVDTSVIDFSADKCITLRTILAALAEKRAVLEQDCMALEERTSRETQAVALKKERLNEAREALQLEQEEAHSLQWSYDVERIQLFQAEKALNSASQRIQLDTKFVEDSEGAMQAAMGMIQDLETAQINQRGMAGEECHQLAFDNDSAKSAQEDLRALLQNQGATCAVDEDIHQTAADLQARLQQLSDEVNVVKYFKREIDLSKKQEKHMLSTTRATIKAKFKQLNWLERQRVHLLNKQKEAADAYGADEAAYEEAVAEHERKMERLDDQNRAAAKQMNDVECAISARENYITAVNETVAAKTALLAQRNEDMQLVKEQLAQAEDTLERLKSETRAAQGLLAGQEKRREQLQEAEGSLAMKTEDLLSACVEMDAAIHRKEKVLAAKKIDDVTAQTCVLNRIDEVRDKFFDNFVVDDSDKLVKLLDKKKEDLMQKEAVRFREFKASFAIKFSSVKQQYDEQSLSLKTRYNEIVRQKEERYNMKVETLKVQATAKEGHSKDVSLEESSATTATRSPDDTRVEGNQSPEENDRPGLGDFEFEQAVVASPGNEKPANEDAHTQTQKHCPAAPSKTRKTQKKRRSEARKQQPTPTQRRATSAQKSSKAKPVEEPTLLDPHVTTELGNVVTKEFPVVHPASAKRSTSSRRTPRSSGAGANASCLQRRKSSAQPGKTSSFQQSDNDAVLSAAQISSGFASLALQDSWDDDIALSGPFDATLSGPKPTTSAHTSMHAAAVPAASSLPGGVTTNCSSQAGARTTKKGASNPQAKAKRLDKLAGKRGKAKSSRNRPRQSKAIKINRISIARSQGGSRSVDWIGDDCFSFD